MTSSIKGHVSREQRGSIMLIGLDRVAKRNAFDMEMLNQLSLAYGEFERNEQARVAVVFAHGEHFTGGWIWPRPATHWSTAGNCRKAATIRGAFSQAPESVNQSSSRRRVTA
jgi:hypothetical protein